MAQSGSGEEGRASDWSMAMADSSVFVTKGGVELDEVFVHWLDILSDAVFDEVLWTSGGNGVFEEGTVEVEDAALQIVSSLSFGLLLEEWERFFFFPFSFSTPII